MAPKTHSQKCYKPTSEPMRELSCVLASALGRLHNIKSSNEALKSADLAVALSSLQSGYPTPFSENHKL